MSDVWETAKSMELEGEKYYRDLAAKTSVQALKGVMEKLAQEERKHYEFFDGLQKKSGPAEMKSDNTLAAAKNMLQKFAAEFESAPPIEEAADVYQKAMEMENETVAVYKRALEEAEDEKTRASLETIIEEEKKHARIVENIVELVRAPQQWVENAEFNKLESY